MKQVTIVIALLFSLFLNVLGQENYLSPIDLSKELPADNFYSVTSDHEGYLWFSTNQGLGRYNGADLTYFNSDNGLSDLEIFGCFQDSHNRLWFRTLNGSICYFQFGDFHVLNKKGMPKFSSFITSIIEFKENIYFGSSSGQVFSYNGKDLEEIFWKEDFAIHEIIPYRDNLLFISPAGLFEFNLKSENVNLIKAFSDPKSYIRATRFDNLLFLSHANQLHSFDMNSRIYEEVLKFESEIIAIDSVNGNLWVGTRSGAFKTILTDHRKVKVKDSFLLNKAVTSICQDFQGGLWMTTLNDGVFYRSLAHLTEIYKSPKGSELGQISSMSINLDKEFLIGFSKNQFGCGEIDNIKFSQLSNYRSLPIKKIQKIDANYFAITGSTILFSDDSFNNDKRYFSFPANDIASDGQGNYLIAGNYLRRISINKFQNLLSKNESKRLANDLFEELLKTRVNCLLQIDIGSVAVGTVGGYYALKNGVLREVKHNGQSLGHITSIQRMNNGRILISTLAKGIFIEQDNGEYKNLSRKDGLSSSSCSKIMGLDSSIWVLTSRGLNQVQILNDKSFQILNYSDVIGPLESRITDIDVFKGQLVFSTADRVLSINEWTNRTIVPPKLLLSKVKADGHIINQKPVVLKANNNRLSFTFENISFQGQEGVQYEYRLKGASSKWSSTTSRSVQFESLPYGDYTFEVRAKNAYGKKSPPIAYSFTVEEVFYKKTLFIILEIIAGSILVLILVIYQIRKVKKRFLKNQRRIALEHELKELEQQALRLQMNPHFIFNALNTIKGFYSSKEVIKANEYISKFSAMLRLILEHKESTITLKKEMEQLELYIDLIRLRYSSKFSFEIILDQKINIEQTIIPAMLIQPFVENAVIHGIAPKIDQGVITVEFKRIKDLLTCKVRDNGNGRVELNDHPLKTDRVNATKIVSRRLDILRNEYKLDLKIVIHDLKTEGKPSGTEVQLTLPYLEQW